MTPDTSAHWGFFTPNAVWRWGEPGSARGERETCECVKTGVEDNRFTLCNLANDEGVTTASFPAWLSESVDKRETFPPSILLKQQKPSAKQNIVFPRFLSELCRFLFFIAPDSAPIFDKGRKVQKLLMSVISVNSLPSTEALALKLTPPPLPWKINYPVREPFMCEVYHRARVLPGILLFHWEGIIGKKRLFFMISNHLSNQRPIQAKILVGQRKLVIVISHLSQDTEALRNVFWDVLWTFCERLVAS